MYICCIIFLMYILSILLLYLSMTISYVLIMLHKNNNNQNNDKTAPLGPWHAVKWILNIVLHHIICRPTSYSNDSGTSTMHSSQPESISSSISRLQQLRRSSSDPATTSPIDLPSPMGKVSDFYSFIII